MTTTAIKNKLPNRRRSETIKVKIGDTSIFIGTGEYEDGTLGELFIDMHREGSLIRALMNGFCIVVSKALQYGVPLEDLCNQFLFTRFEPSGPVRNHPDIKRADSILDLIFRHLAIKYLGREDLKHRTKPDQAAAN